MSKKNCELVQETLEMPILKTLTLEPLHGYAIAIRIQQISEGVFRVGPGLLFPAFSRLESAGHIDSEWRAMEKDRRAKHHKLTCAGRKVLKLETHAWDRQTAALTRILEA